jgi:hypothetical protein
MAETYTRAVLTFGYAGLFSLIGFTIMVVVLAITKSSDYLLLGFIIVCAITIVALILFVTAVYANTYNLSIATKQCYFGTNAEIAAHQHERAQMAWPEETEIWKGPIHWDDVPQPRPEQ